MNNQSFNSNGVLQEGCYYCNIESDVELSNKIYERNVPSRPLAPQFSMRSVPTKYSHFPIVDPRPPAQLVPIKPHPTYNVETVFNPGTAQAPWSGFATSIDRESSLRNQFFALQKCDQREYVPSTASDMFESVIPVIQNTQTHPLLFKQEQFDKFDANPYGTGKKFFDNHTRQEIKNVKSCTNK
jgi:hypothetical protein